MMKFLCNERGNSAIYFLWLLGIVAVIFLILTNMAKVFITGHGAKNAVEQAAFAGTAVYIEATKKAIDDFDTSPFSTPAMIQNGGKTINQLITDKQNQYENAGLSSDQAYMKALNIVLPSEIDDHEKLKTFFENNFYSINSKVFTAVQDIIDETGANSEDTQVTLSSSDWRLEVESTATFESISDNKLVSIFQKKIPSKGYGPQLLYLKNVYE